jgi:hypothetical protein
MINQGLGAECLDVGCDVRGGVLAIGLGATVEHVGPAELVLLGPDVLQDVRGKQRSELGGTLEM